MTLDIRFQGLAAPLRLIGADAILPLLAEVAVAWPHEVGPADPNRHPFCTISRQPDGLLYLCESHVEDRPARPMDALNALCDAIASLAMAMAIEDDELLCLHAAGVVMADQVVIFPNIRRAGKSTLAAALAQAGCPVFSDDVLPIRFPSGHSPVAHSMGIAPRLRLPLPDSLPSGFRSWAEATPGPQNRQYKYLALPNAPRSGDRRPVGAFVILDRQDTPAKASLVAVPPDAAMDALLHQHFTRDRHSGDILTVMAAALSQVPVWQLTYSDLEDAVACLQASFVGPSGPAFATDAPVRFRMADFSQPPHANPAAQEWRQRPGVTAREIGDGLYLADPEGRAIHRIDPLAAAIWELLEAPATMPDILELLAPVFPAAPRSQLEADVQALLATWTAAHLIA